MIPLLPNLNYLLLKNKPDLVVKDLSPSTYPALKSWIGGPIPVWSGKSDTTIYGDPLVNYVFRALHDISHRDLNADFTLEGEVKASLPFVQWIEKELGTLIADIVYLDTIGQATYFAETGFFVNNQLNWILSKLNNNGGEIK